MRTPLFLAILPLLAASPARAADPVLLPLQFSGIYAFHWGAIAFGEVAITVNQKESGYDIKAHVRSVGLVRMFASHESRNTVVGGSGAFTTAKRTYETYYTTKKKPKHVKLAYAAGGAVTEELVEPPEDRSNRPEVPGELKAGSLDPLTYVLAVREALYQSLQNGSQDFQLRLFDGRRLMDTFYRIGGRDTAMTWDGTQADVIKLEARRDAVAGYTQKELGGMATDPPMFVYFSDDSLLVPTKLRVDLWFGSLEADLIQRCDIHKPCEVGEKFSPEKAPAEGTGKL